MTIFLRLILATLGYTFYVLLISYASFKTLFRFFKLLQCLNFSLIVLPVINCQRAL